MKKFKITNYEITSEKISQELRFVMISDWHNVIFGERNKPVFEAIHAGLECGILSGKIKDLDCVSFGPNNYDIHTPKERLSISSTEKVWKLLVAFLKKCK